MPILHWLSRDEDIRAAAKAPYRLLEEAADLSYGDAAAGNMLIQGDNLEALKALLPFYAGRVKCIYIDPPYNTRSAFEHYDDNLEHTQWLAMMWPRLELLRELLADDGLMFCQIDDNEGAYLTIISDEIIGRRNRVNVISVKMSEATGVKMYHAAKRLPKMKEYILVYQKSLRPTLRPISVPNAKWNDEYKELLIGADREKLSLLKTLIDAEECEESDVAVANQYLQGVQIISLSDHFETIGYPLAKQDEFKWENAWRIVQAVGAGSIKERALQARVASQEISAVLSPRRKLYVFKTRFNEKSRDPRIRIIFADKYLTSHPGDFWADIKTTGGIGQEGGVEFPRGKKPERLIQRILDLHTSPGDLVLDSFLGSGTTAAVAQKMGRRFIGIEIGEHAITHCAPRLRNVVEGEQGGISEAVGWKGGGGFRFYRLGPPVFDEAGHIRADVAFPTLAAHVWFSETETPWGGPLLPCGGETERWDQSSLGVRGGPPSLPSSAKWEGFSPFLGIHGGSAYALLYNGVLRDRRPRGGNVLTRATLAIIRTEIARAEPDFNGPLTIYGEQARLTEPTLARECITFKQTPYDVKARR